jgi:hypothetical protein
MAQIGYYLYNKYNLTTQISKHIEILSNRLQQDQATIGNVNIKKLDAAYTPERVKIAEALEILQHYQYIEDLDETSLRTYLDACTDILPKDVAYVLSRH